MTAGAVGQESPQKNAGGAADEEGRQRARGETERGLIDRDHGGDGERLDADL